MAYDKSKGLISIATSHDGSEYHYEKIDQYIQKESYTCTPKQMQDLDSYVNANGYLKRKTMKHPRTKIDVDTPYMSYKDKKALVHILRLGMKTKNCLVSQRKVRVRYYNDWTDDYEHGFFYVPDVDFKVAGTYKGVPQYMPTRFGFIEY